MSPNTFFYMTGMGTLLMPFYVDYHWKKPGPGIRVAIGFSIEAAVGPG